MTKYNLTVFEYCIALSISLYSSYEFSIYLIRAFGIYYFCGYMLLMFIFWTNYRQRDILMEITEILAIWSTLVAGILSYLLLQSISDEDDDE